MENQVYHEDWRDPLDNIPDNLDEWCDTCGYEICRCDEDYCCYDPRYRGPKDYCACTEYARQMEWEYSFRGKALTWIRDTWNRVKIPVQRFKQKYFPKEYFTNCVSCKGRYSVDKNGWHCPHCNTEDLPF